jgi:hypothetical protein
MDARCCRVSYYDTLRGRPRRFMEMFGASQGPHKTQPATLKIDDPNSPLTKSFGGQPFTLTDEYYCMTDTGLQGTYYSRDKVHVLFSVDTAKSSDFNSGPFPFMQRRRLRSRLDQGLWQGARILHLPGAHFGGDQEVRVDDTERVKMIDHIGILLLRERCDKER